MNVRCVLFDVDGTLLDTAPGVEAAVRYAEGKMGLSPIAQAELRKFVGPPPREMYQKIYALCEKDARAAAEHHRLFGRETGLYQSKPYPGMVNALAEFARAGLLMGVATLKAQDVAERILRHHEMDGYFSTVVGVDAGENRTKKETILLALANMGQKSENAVMVGDSFYDAEGAALAGTKFIGVTYGYGFSGTDEVLRFAGAKAARNIEDIIKEVLQ